MKYLDIKLPDGEMKISKIVMGTDHFGTAVPEEDAYKLLDAYVDAGGNCIDTARSYAIWLPGRIGASEEQLGKWMKERGNRNKILISTKGAHPALERMDINRLSRKDIEKDLDDSLLALGTDTIDIYWLHRDDPAYPVEDIMETLASAVARGKVRAIGCSNWTTKRIQEANSYAAGKGYPQFFASQIQWSLATSTAEAHNDKTIVCMDENEYAWYLKEQFPVFAFSSQAKGFFAKAAALGIDSLNDKAKKRFVTPENLERLARVKEYSAQKGISPAAVALGYVLYNKVPSIAIVGCKKLDQLMDSLTALDTELPAEVAEWLFKG